MKLPLDTKQARESHPGYMHHECGNVTKFHSRYALIVRNIILQNKIKKKPMKKPHLLLSFDDNQFYVVDLPEKPLYCEAFLADDRVCSSCYLVHSLSCKAKKQNYEELLKQVLKNQVLLKDQRLSAQIVGNFHSPYPLSESDVALLSLIKNAEGLKCPDQEDFDTEEEFFEACRKHRMTLRKDIKPAIYEATKQKGTPGACYQAQVFKDGKAFIAIEPTEDPQEATDVAIKIAEILNQSSD